MANVKLNGRTATTANSSRPVKIKPNISNSITSGTQNQERAAVVYRHKGYHFRLAEGGYFCKRYLPVYLLPVRQGIYLLYQKWRGRENDLPRHPIIGWQRH